MRPRGSSRSRRFILVPVRTSAIFAHTSRISLRGPKWRKEPSRYRESRIPFLAALSWSTANGWASGMRWCVCLAGQSRLAMRERYGSSSCCCAAPAIFRMELEEVGNVSRKNQRGHPANKLCFVHSEALCSGRLTTTPFASSGTCHFGKSLGFCDSSKVWRLRLRLKSDSYSSIMLIRGSGLGRLCRTSGLRRI